LRDRARNEAFLDPGALEELVDAFELIAKLPVIRVAHDGRQSGPQRLGKGDQGSRHKLSYKIAYLDKQARKK
jgi:hypothetical protein